MSNRGRSRSGNGSKKRCIDGEDGSNDSHEEHSMLDQKMTATGLTETGSLRKEKSGKRKSKSTRTVQGRSASTLFSGNANEEPTRPSTTTTQSTNTIDSRESQAVPLHITSDPLFSIALQHVLNQGLDLRNNATSRPMPLHGHVDGALSSAFEGGISSMTSQPDTPLLPQTTMMVKYINQFSLVVNQTNTNLLIFPVEGTAASQ